MEGGRERGREMEKGMDYVCYPPYTYFVVMSWLSSSYSVYTQTPVSRQFLTGLCINLSFAFSSRVDSYISPLQPLYLPLFVVYYYVHELGHSLAVTHELGVTSPTCTIRAPYKQTPTPSTLFYRALVFITMESI